jgi:hypothetical protein
MFLSPTLPPSSGVLMTEMVLVSETSADLILLMLLSAQEEMTESTVTKRMKTKMYQWIL